MSEEECILHLPATTHYILSFFSLVPQTYVQDLIEKEANSLYQLIMNEDAHIYICGDVTMAEHVYQTIR